MNVSTPYLLPNLGGHFVEPVGVCDGMDGIEAQPVETIFDEPVERIVGEEAPYFLTSEIDRCAPRRADIAAKHFRRVAPQIISIGPKMVVDDVQKYHKAVIVCGVDE